MMFSIAYDPWIPVLDLNGKQQEVSLRDVLTKAHTFRVLAAETTMQDVAITRILLAVLHRAIDGPRTLADWKDLREQTHSPALLIDAYLKRHADRFLLSGREPFMQTAGIVTTKGEGPQAAWLDRLEPVASRRMWTGSPPSRVTPAEAARHLVTLHAFDVAGIKTGLWGDPEAKSGRGYSRGAGWCARYSQVIITGADLWDTLAINAIPLGDDISIPFWEQATLPPHDRGIPPAGRLELYSWNSRRVLLREEDGWITGVLIGQGDRIDWSPGLDPTVAESQGKGWRSKAPHLQTWLKRFLAAYTEGNAIPPVVEALKSVPPKAPIGMGVLSVWQGVQASAWYSANAGHVYIGQAVFNDKGARQAAILALTQTSLGLSAVVKLMHTILFASGGISAQTEARAQRDGRYRAAEVSEAPLRKFLQSLVTRDDVGRVSREWSSEMYDALYPLGWEMYLRHAKPGTEGGLRESPDGKIASSSKAQLDFFAKIGWLYSMSPKIASERKRELLRE